MAVQKRLNELVSLLKNTDQALSGAFLAEHFNVSRQIIVTDITRLRDKGLIIHSTPKGYILDRASCITQIFKVFHTEAQTEEELNLFVDLGAEVRDVFIYHRIYGEIHAKLNIRSRRDVKTFCDNIKSGKSSPLMNITSGYHYHTIVTSDIETMNLVKERLSAGHFLAKLTDYEPDGVYKE